MGVTPIESLQVIVSVLQRMSLPQVADDPKQLSHAVLSGHVENVATALQPNPDKPETKEAK